MTQTNRLIVCNQNHKLVLELAQFNQKPYLRDKHCKKTLKIIDLSLEKPLLHCCGKEMVLSSVGRYMHLTCQNCKFKIKIRTISDEQIISEVSMPQILL